MKRVTVQNTREGGAGPMTLVNILWLVAGVFGAILVLQLLRLILLNILPVKDNEVSSAPRPSYASPAPMMAPAPAPVPAPQPQYQMPQQPVQQRPSYAPAVPPPPADGIARIAIIAGVPQLQEFPLPGNLFAVGRFYDQGQNILISMDEKSVSRRHAQLRANPAAREFYVQDLGSSFGTFMVNADGTLNKLQPNREERLYNGDQVQFGNAVRVRFSLPTESRTSVTQL
jgi:predicted component of type VI protein secretion system